MFASKNNFTAGDIPASFENLINLQELGLKSTNLFGEIPTFLGAMVNLVLLDLDDNDLSANLPTELGQLTDLEFLLLNRNDLSGPIPTEFSSLTLLRVAFLDRNALTGSLDALCALPTFNEAEGDFDGTELLIADCDGVVPEIACTCCTTCCNDQVTACHDNFEIANLDPIWEFDNDRLRYSFGNTSFFFSSDVLP